MEKLIGFGRGAASRAQIRWVFPLKPSIYRDILNSHLSSQNQVIHISGNRLIPAGASCILYYTYYYSLCMILCISQGGSKSGERRCDCEQRGGRADGRKSKEPKSKEPHPSLAIQKNNSLERVFLGFKSFKGFIRPSRALKSPLGPYKAFKVLFRPLRAS